jgi:hypothetical protein
MKTTVGVAVVLSVFAAAPARAQSPEGYALAAFGGWTQERRSSALGGGSAGVELRMGNRLAAGGELGVLAGLRGNAMLDFAARGRVALAPSTARVVPFAGAGYSRLWFFEGYANALNIGAGLDIGTSPGRTVRVEFRDVIRPQKIATHFWTFRIGFAFR